MSCALNNVNCTYSLRIRPVYIFFIIYVLRHNSPSYSYLPLTLAVRQIIKFNNTLTKQTNIEWKEAKNKNLKIKITNRVSLTIQLIYLAKQPGLKCFPEYSICRLEISLMAKCSSGQMLWLKRHDFWTLKIYSLIKGLKAISSQQI